MADTQQPFPKGPYQPADHEDVIYSGWEESGLFNPDTCIEKGVTNADAPPFSIVLPPPNVTGTLHMGHAAMLAIEDAIVRYRRMKGDRTLWIPGTDHAAIATASKVEKQLYENEEKTRYDLGREAFLERVDQFAKESHDTIVNQLKKMGSSLDWSREAFTLDDARTHAVRTAFKRMYDDGLIYRDYRVVNWDPRGETTISDDEIKYQEEEAALYTFRYSSDFPIPIATTRPETKVGDTAVAVNPNDERYKEYIGNKYDVSFAGTELHITVIADESIDPEYGTGALGVTPAHSGIDWELARKHNIPLIQVIDENARMKENAGLVAGYTTGEAREKVVEWLQENALLENKERVEQRLATAERTGATIEPLPKLQWFIDVNKTFTLPHSKIGGIPAGSEVTLKGLMRHVVETKQTTILPEQFEKIYYHWIDNLRDWCISRQIWYGHRIPVWYREDVEGNQETYCGIEPPEEDGWEQDPDTLDTWFSSGLWTFSTLGWPENTDDLKAYHPTSLLETGHDILFFWVARMILMSTYHLGEIPFSTVFLHGMVRDGEGNKMSKSLNNILDPLDLIPEYGADATRMSLLAGAAPGNDINVGEDKLKAYKRFSNKIWNASKFVVSQLDDDFSYENKPELTEHDTRRIEECYEQAQSITKHLDAYRLHLAAEEAYHYFWDTFADVIIEESKSVLQEGDAAARASKQWMLTEILCVQLKLLHPFIPFVTEAIWERLPTKPNEAHPLLLGSSWPA